MRVNQLGSAVRPTGLNSKRTESPRNARRSQHPPSWMGEDQECGADRLLLATRISSGLLPSAYALANVHAFRADDGRETPDGLVARATDTSQLWSVPSFTTVTVSPVTWATQRAAESALAKLRYALGRGLCRP